MKYLFFAFLFFAGSLLAQDYIYDVTSVTDSTYRLIITDQSTGEPPYPAQDFGVLSTQQLRRTLYEIAEEQYNAIGEARAYDFFLNVQADKALAALDDLSLNNYDQAVTNAIRRKFDGIYQYSVTGTQIKLEVRVENLVIYNNANNNQLATISPKSRRFITIVNGAGNYNLYTTNDNLYVGRNLSDQVVVLRRKSGLPTDEEGLNRP